MPQYLLPIHGLHLLREWKIGATLILPGDEVRERLLDLISKEEQSELIYGWMGNSLSAVTETAVIQVDAASLDEAMSVASDSLACLRIFHYSSTVEPTGLFGLPDEVAKK